MQGRRIKINQGPPCGPNLFFCPVTLTIFISTEKLATEKQQQFKSEEAAKLLGFAERRVLYEFKLPHKIIGIIKMVISPNVPTERKTIPDLFLPTERSDGTLHIRPVRTAGW
jgi:hypothetical protein